MSSSSKGKRNHAHKKPYPKSHPAAAAMSVREVPPKTQSGRAAGSLRDRRKRLGINQSLFAKIGGFSLRTMASYEDADKVPAKVQRQFQEALRLTEALSEILGEHLVDWLQEANPGFDDRTPLEVIESGEVDQLWDMIHQQRHLAFE